MERHIDVYIGEHDTQADLAHHIDKMLRANDAHLKEVYRNDYWLEVKYYVKGVQKAKEQQKIDKYKADNKELTATSTIDEWADYKVDWFKVNMCEHVKEFKDEADKRAMNDKKTT